MERVARNSLRAKLILVTDEHRRPDPLPVAARLPPGSLVIFRHYGWPDRAALARRLARLCRARRLVLVIGADFDLAVALRAGLHLPEGLAAGAPPRVRLWQRAGGGPLTVAAHGRIALVRGRRLRADAALLSPVFATPSHPGAPGLGVMRFRGLARRAGLPVFALGGVTRATARKLRSTRAAGLAAVDAPAIAGR